jgi:hypothetical protein
MDHYDIEEFIQRTAPTRRIVARVGLAVAVGLVLYGGARWWNDSAQFARLLPTRCTLTKRDVEWTLRASSGRSRGSRKARAWYEGVAHLELTHTLEGRRYPFTAEASADERLEVGKSYDCRYDPRDPARVTLAASFEPELDSFALAVALALLSLLLRR